ncbi:MAG: ABC transporter substrate-binding protein [Actinomycetota bacterium]|nr:ABC transporter substrate-binding protein [Actinomycetota bacterium]
MTATMRRRGAVLLVGGVAATMLLAACGSSSTTSESSAAPAESSAAPSSEAPSSEAPVAAGCEAYAAYTGNEGTSVTLFTSVLPPEQQRYEDAWKPFEDCTGIDIVYEGSDQFEAQLPTRIAGGNAPDLAWIPQPGLLAKLVQAGGPVPAPQGVSDNVDMYYNPAWKAYGTVDGTFYAAPNSSNMKSFVWYSPKVFAEKGYTVPTTWDEMFALSDQMVADGIKPWCGGIESGGATGWPATDWIEQIVLRQFGGDVYDQWVAHTILFDSPEITAAMDTLAGWMKNGDYVNGGFGNVQTIATTAFQDAGSPILDAECGMLQQASFYAAQWESFKPGAVVAEDGDVFAFFLPQISDEFPNPVVGGGEFTTAFSDRPEVQAVQTYLSSAEYATARASQPGGWVSANSGVPLDTYTDAIAGLSAKYLTDPAGIFRFDASDLMPAAVGAGSFWTGMTAWFGEDAPTQEVLAEIDAAWPAS